MKKISLFLLTTLMVTSAYSGGPEFIGGDALNDKDFELMLSNGSFGGAEGPDGSDGDDENAFAVVHDPEALCAAVAEEGAVPEEEERDGVVASHGPMFDLCSFVRTVREGAQVTIEGARDQLHRVPKLECPCVKRKLKQGEAAAEELVGEMRNWFDALQRYHDEARNGKKPKEAAEGADVASLQKKLAESDAKLAAQEEQLVELRSKIEQFRPLFESLREQK